MIGPFHLYGLLIGLGVWLGWQVCRWVAKREGVKPEVVDDGLTYALVGGVVGARLYHVVDQWQYYSKNLIEILMLWQGGLGIFGAIGGGIVGVLLYYIRNKQVVRKNLLWLLDVAVFGMPIGQAVGRMGNFVNHELYGKPTQLPWGFYVDFMYRPKGFESFSRFHPLFLYEAILNIGLLGVLVWLYVKNKITLGKGKFLAVYLIGYGSIRFGLENLRVGNWVWADVPVAQIVSLMVVLVGVGLIIKPEVKSAK